MKTITKTLFALISGVMLFSCAAPLPNRIDDYVEEVEASCQYWTVEDWELSNYEYEALVEEYRQNYDSYTQEEREAINKAIGRYNGLRIKHGLEDLSNTIKEIGEQLPTIVEGFMSAFE